MMPAYREYLEPYKGEADIIINNNVDFQEGLNHLGKHFREVFNR
jgi:hypothetical protein